MTLIGSDSYSIAQLLKATGVDDKTEYMVFEATEAWKFVNRFLGFMLDAEAS
jgi:hypothetical protein